MAEQSFIDNLNERIDALQNEDLRGDVERYREENEFIREQLDECRKECALMREKWGDDAKFLNSLGHYCCACSGCGRWVKDE